MAAAKTTKAVVARPFTGVKERNRVFMPGDTFEGSATRVSELRAQGLLSEDAPEEPTADTPEEE